jgi:hypothetical protein
MRLTIHRSDGKSGKYFQDDVGRAAILSRRLDPATLFTTGPIVIGVLNPFTILNADEVCWIEAESERQLMHALPQGVESVRKLAGRSEYENILARQWPRWRQAGAGAPQDLMEALVELSFKGGAVLYLHVIGQVTSAPLTDMIFSQPAVTATFEPHGTAFIDPRSIVRARAYHSLQSVQYPAGLWCLEADDI